MSIIISMKYHEEYYIENRYFFKQASRYWSINDIKELNKLEKAFLEAIDYRLKVEKDEQDRYFEIVEVKAKELQWKQFKVLCQNYIIIDDYFSSKNSEHNISDKTGDKNLDCPTTKQILPWSKFPQIMLNDKLFNSSEEVYHFFNCEEICEDKTTISEGTSQTASGGSLKDSC